MQMNVWVGTSGFAYKEWKGAFYPEDLPNSEMLEYYGKQLNAVEINNTFYRMPNAKILTGWSDRVPERFSFVLKASRKITHFKKLKDCEDELEYLIGTASELGERLGPMLFQLPPYLKKDTALLRDFLALFPEGFRAAFEFRSSSWFDDEIYEALGSRSAALVVADSRNEKLPPVVQDTASFGYARLRKEGYDVGELRDWSARLAEPAWHDLYVFFKHEDAGAGPRLARRFSDVVDEA